MFVEDRTIERSTKYKKKTLVYFVIETLRFKLEAISILFLHFYIFSYHFRFQLRKSYTAETPELARVTHG